MNKVSSIGFLFLSLLVCLPLYAQQNVERLSLRDAMLKKHIAPKVLDDHFSEQLFHAYIEALDPRGEYFLQKDITELSVYELQLDDEWKGNSWGFLPRVTEIYKERLLKAEKVCNELAAKPLNYTIKDTAFFSKEREVEFSENEEEFKKGWAFWFKYNTLVQLMSLPQDTLTKYKNILVKEPEVRRKLNKKAIRNVQRIVKHPDGYENYLESLYYNTFTALFDPHSAYFSKRDWQRFEDQLSKEVLSFGFELEESDAGEIRIARLVPGGAAWKSNELHKGDVLIELQWDGKPAVDLTDISLDELDVHMGNSNTGRMRLNVKTNTGMTKSVFLVKSKIDNEQNIVKGYILKGEKKIGYIALPGFYSEWDNGSSSGCANDVAKEILKLKEEKIEGLILDIRDNGGGSLQEGISLAGIFVNEGPMLLLKNVDGKLQVIKDLNRGTIYDGPLAVMINGQSASASELVASTLQDYNRAVIVGGNSYGKATGQTPIPLDTTMDLTTSDVVDKSKYGVATVTVHKLYRVTGGSAQMKGVCPDVTLPDLYDILDYRESSLENAFPNDSVIKKVYYTPLVPLPVSALKQKSKERLQNDSSYRELKKLLATVPFFLKQTDRQLLLQPDVVKKTLREHYLWWNAIDAATVRKTKSYEVVNNAYEAEVIKVDDYGKESNSLIIKNIESDVYLDQTYKVVADLINLSNN